VAVRPVGFRNQLAANGTLFEINVAMAFRPYPTVGAPDSDLVLWVFP
jgi:hypothetical protein